MSAGCRKDKEEWEKIKWSNDVSQIENFISEFPESNYLDSALITLERMIFLKSDNSTTVTGTFKDYLDFVKKYPRMVEIIDTVRTIKYLKLKADTLEIHGRLVDTENAPITNERINATPIDAKGRFKITVGDDGLVIFDPYDYTNSDGEFVIKAHRSFLYENNEFTFSMPSFGWYETEEGIPIIIKIDSNLRVLKCDTLTVKR